MSTANVEPKKKKSKGKIIGGVIAFLLVIGLIGSCMGGDDTGTEPAGDATTSAVAPTDGATEDATTENAATEESPEADAPESIPSDYRSALGSAESYIRMMSFSKAGLYDQLTSQFEQFSPEAAQYAVDNVDADWNAEALESAESYRDTMNMSPGAIYDQLVSQFEQYTPEEAQYAVDNLN